MVAAHIDRRAKAALISIVGNLALVLIKLLGARLSLSVAMGADAVHSLSDVVVSLMVLAGVYFSNRNGRWLKTVENCLALLISFFIIGAALGLLVRAFEDRGQQLTNIPVTLVWVWVCILVSYGISQYQIRVGREEDSPSLLADGYHSRMDMYSSVAVLVSLLGGWIGLQLDAWASVIVVLLILKIGLEVLFGAVQGLLQSEVVTFEAFLFLSERTRGSGETGGRDDSLRVFQDFVSRWIRKGGGVLWQHRRLLALVTIIVVLAAYGASGAFIVRPGETAVVLRFGELPEGAQPLTPGLHYRLPSPATQLMRVQPAAVRQLEFGFRTIARREDTVEPAAYLWESMHQSGIYEKVKPEAVMLTGDKNEVDLNLAIEYCVAEGATAAYLFNLADTEKLVRCAAECCIRCTVAVMPLTDALTTGRAAIEQRIMTDLQALLATYKAGVRVTAVRLQDVHPPIEVVPAFRRVATAREDKVTQINRAVGYQRATIPKARGGAKYIRADAEAYRKEKVQNAAGDVVYFEAMASAFREAPESAAFLMYMDNVEEILPPLRKVLISPEANLQSEGTSLGGYFMFGEFMKGVTGDLMGFGAPPMR